MNRTLLLKTIFCFLFYISTISATSYYVDKDATGNNNGTSWQNAWTSFGSINWGILNPGDVIYISGGSASKTYMEELDVRKSGSQGNNILITKGTTPGHNGKVILDGGRSISHNISLQSVKYVTVQYLSVRGATGGGNIDIDGCTGVIVDSCDIYADSGHGGISIKTSSGVHLQRNYITTPQNTSDQTDGIYSQANTGKNYYHDNVIVISNTNSSPHCDGIQSYKDRDLDIYNNYVEQDNAKTSNAQGIYLTTPVNGSTFRIWNNIMNHTQSNSNGLAVRNLGSSGITVSMIGNTIYGETGSDHSIWMTEMTSTPTVKNNIIHFVGFNGNGIVISGAGYGNTSHNLQSNTVHVRGSNAITSDPLFKDITNRDFSLQASSPAIDAGIDLGNPFNVDINGTQRPQGGGWDIGAYENYSGPDVTSPQLQSAQINNPTQLVLFFSESLNFSSAQNSGNYSIDNSVSVLSATLSSNSREVTLSTSVHTPNIQHTVTVSNVTDLAGNTISSSANSAQYLIEADVTPPEVSSAQLDNATTLMVYFSEQIDGSSASNVSNYSSNNGIQFTNAVLSGNNQSVQLTTTDHTVGQSYTVSVNNVLDLAGNLVSQQSNSADYIWDGSSALYQQNISSAYANDWYLDYMPEKAIDGIAGTTTSSRWAGAIPMPDSILFDLGSSRTFSKTRISFYEWDFGRIYEYALEVSDDLINWQTIVANTFSSSSQWSEETFSPVQGRYLLLVSLSNNQSVWAGVWEAEVYGPDQPSDVGDDTESPTEYLLSQNYPNPFNPATKISFTLPEDARVRITVYNLLGEQVAELEDKDFAAGSHTVSFQAEGLTSGIYFYKMEAGNFISTKKMTLIR